MEPQCLVSRGRPKNIVLFEREDVTVMENGVVLTKSLSEIEQIKRKPGRFKTKINFRRDMTSGEVRRTLEENFPTLQNRRFSCAARGTQNSARLEFHGFRRVWDGKTINSKLKGSSVLYLVMEDEPPVSQEALFGTESASSMQGHSRYSNDNSENNQQMSQLLPQSATVTSSGGTDCNSRANPADNINLHEDFFGPSFSPGSFDCEVMIRTFPYSAIHGENRKHSMEGDLPQLSPGVLDFLDETGSTQSKRQSQIGLSELYRDVANHCSDHWTGLTIGLTDQTSGPMTYPAFNPPWIGTVGAMPPNAEVLAQSQPYENQVFEACSTDTSPRRESGFSSEESSSMDQAIDLSHSIPREAGVEVKPSKGPLEGGEVFELTFDKSLPDAVTSALATFGNKQVEVWKTYEGGFVLHGKSIPPGEVPGTVPVTITTKNGAYLGKTEFTYVNQYEETLKQIVQSRSLQGQLFKMLSKQCENDESEENNTQPFGLPSDGRQRQAVDILRCLVYTAAGIGAEEFIRMIFSTSTGRIVFEAYKNESPLPEDIADANGHEEIATFLQAITKRFSEEETTSQTRSEGINWHELARAVEESEEQSVAWPSKKDVKQLKEDDLFEREYFGDGETSSSDSEKERCDNEDQFAARFSEVSVTEEDEVQPASDLSLENDCCDTSTVAHSVRKKKQKFSDLPLTGCLSHVVQWLYNTQETDTTDERVDVIVNAANDALQHGGGTTQTQQNSSGTWDDDAADNFATKGSSSFEVQRQVTKFITQVYKHKLQDIEEKHSVEIIWSENASQVQICSREKSNNPHSYREGCDAFIDLYRNLHSNMSREVVELKGADNRAFIIEAIKAVESENPVIIEMTGNKLLVFAEINNITSSVQALKEKPGSSQGGSRETRRSQRNTNLSAREHESSQEDRFSAAMQLLSNGVKLSLYQSDITDERVNAIVNAANDGLQHAGGVAAAIVRKGGRQIEEESRRIMSDRRWHSLNVGDAVYTRGGNLSCQFVIHTVCPRWNARERSSCILLLHRAWVERLHLAAQSQLCSIALPAISSGIFGMPKSICAQGMFEAIEEFRSNTDAEFSTLRDVRIVIIDDKPIRVSLEKLVKRYTSRETSSTTSPRQERHQLPSSEKRKACSSLNVTIKHPSFSSADDSSDGQSTKRGKDNGNDESRNKGVCPNMGSNETREQMPDSIKRVIPSNNKNVPNGNKDNPPNGNKKSSVETEVHGSSKEKGLKGSPLEKGLELSNVTTAAKSPSGSGRGIRAACFCGRPYEEVGSKSSGSTQLAKTDETKSAKAGKDQDPIQIGLDPSHQLTETDIHDYQLPEKIGDKWRDLARALKYSQANIDSIQKDQGGSTKECCITVLVRWMGRKGRNATVKKLAEALIKVELKNVADELMCMDTSQNDRFNKTISQMQTNCRHLEEEGSKMRLTIKELEEKLSIATQKYQDAEREGSEMRTKIKQLETRLQDSKHECTTLRIKVSELEEDLAIQRQQQQDNKEEVQEGLGNSVDAAAKVKDVSGATANDLDTDQANRERGINIQLKNLNEKLKKELTSLLQVPEVKEDKLKTAVKLDLLTKLSESLQDMYSEIQSMVAERCKCNEDLKREFYDFAYHGLRAEHNDLVLRVKDLESSQAEMSEDERKAFERLQQYQNNRQRQIDRLEKVWRGLFSSPESLPETSCSDPTGGNNNSKKALSRNRTDPGDRKKQTKPLEGATSSVTPPASDEEVELCLKFKQRSTMRSFFRPRESKDNMCLPVSYRTHRDS